MRATLAPIFARAQGIVAEMGGMVGAGETRHSHLLEAGTTVTADDVSPAPEHLGGRAARAREEVHGVEPAHERRRASGGAGGDELLFDEDDAPGFLAREMVGEAGAVHATADDHDVRHAWGGARPCAVPLTRRSG